MWPKYDKPFFFHIRNDLLKNDKNAVTVCFVPKVVGEKIFSIGVAICNKKDTFNKKLGRLISEGRARKLYTNVVITANKKRLQFQMKIVIKWGKACPIVSHEWDIGIAP